MIALLVFAMFVAFLMGLRSISIFAVMIGLVVLTLVCMRLDGYKQAIVYVVLTQTSYVVGLFIISVVHRRR